MKRIFSIIFLLAMLFTIVGCGSKLTHIDAHDPSCTVDGNMAYDYDEAKGEYYINGIKVDAEDVIIASSGHSWKWVVDQDATFSASGFQHEECSKCKEKRNLNTVIDKLTCEHSSVSLVSAVDSTCVKEGHLAAYICDDCGYYFSDADATELIGNEEAYNAWIAVGGAGSLQLGDHSYADSMQVNAQEQLVIVHKCSNTGCNDEYSDTPIDSITPTKFATDNASIVEGGFSTSKYFIKGKVLSSTYNQTNVYYSIVVLTDTGTVSLNKVKSSLTESIYEDDIVYVYGYAEKYQGNITMYPKEEDSPILVKHVNSKASVVDEVTDEHVTVNITNAGSVTGDVASFTLTPDEGYVVYGVNVNGYSATLSGDVYSFIIQKGGNNEISVVVKSENFKSDTLTINKTTLKVPSSYDKVSTGISGYKITAGQVMVKDTAIQVKADNPIFNETPLDNGLVKIEIKVYKADGINNNTYTLKVSKTKDMADPKTFTSFEDATFAIDGEGYKYFQISCSKALYLSSVVLTYETDEQLDKKACVVDNEIDQYCTVNITNPGENLGDTATFTATPDDGYRIKNVIVDGVKLTAKGGVFSYTLNIYGEYEIDVAIEEDTPEDPSITLKNTSFALAQKYAELSATVGGVDFKLDQGYKGDNSTIQMNSTKGTGSLYNTSAFSGDISKIKINVDHGNKTYTVYVSDTADFKNAKTYTGTSSEEFDIPTGYKYFKLKVSGASYFSSIQIFYKDSK